MSWPGERQRRPPAVGRPGRRRRRDLAHNARIGAAVLVAVLASVSAVVMVRNGLGADPMAALTPGPAPTTDPPAQRTPSPKATSPSPSPTPSPTVEPGRHPVSGFLHPGIVVSLEQLDIARGHVNAGREPWKRAFDRMARSEYADLGWQPRPREVVECGYFSNPNIGCDDEERDAVAAYTHALLWYLTRQEAHARKATEIIDAWSASLRSHTNGNAPLQAGWSAASLVRAAEIMRYTYAGWPAPNVQRAAAMFRDAYLPLLRNGAPRSEGNWDLIILDAAASIAVFLDDRPLFDHVVQLWRARLPAYIYLSGDGAAPVRPPAGPITWHGLTTYVDGVSQETCRDLGHTAWGLEAMAQLAETAWIQGVDLYAEARQRLVASLEFHAAYALGDPVPGWLCGGSLSARFTPIPEIAYNHYHGRLGIDMPRTAHLINQGRPAPASHFYAWGTVTHASGG